MSKTEKATKAVTITAPAEVIDFFEELHWEKRVPRARLITEVLTEWAVGHGLVLSEGDEDVE